MEYAPGSNFSEMDLAKELGTPRAKVREAFSLLAQDNLIQIIPQRRTTICKLDLGYILDSIFITRSILIAVVKDALLTPMVKKIVIEQLREVLSSAEKSIVFTDADFFRVDHQFYQALSELNGFQRLNKIIFKEKVNIDRTLRLSLTTREERMTIVSLYGKITDGLLVDNPHKSIKALCDLAITLEAYAHQAKKNHPNWFQ